MSINILVDPSQIHILSIWGMGRVRDQQSTFLSIHPRFTFCRLGRGEGKGSMSIWGGTTINIYVSPSQIQILLIQVRDWQSTFLSIYPRFTFCRSWGGGWQSLWTGSTVIEPGGGVLRTLQPPYLVCEKFTIRTKSIVCTLLGLFYEKLKNVTQYIGILCKYVCEPANMCLFLFKRASSAKSSQKINTSLYCRMVFRLKHVTFSDMIWYW